MGSMFKSGDFDDFAKKFLEEIFQGKLEPAGEDGFKTNVNGIDVVITFLDKPQSEVQDNILRILVNSYRSRIFP